MKVWSLHFLILHLLKRQQYSWLVTFAFGNVYFNYIFTIFSCSSLISPLFHKAVL